MFAVIGGLVLLFVDGKSEGRRLFAGLPSTGEDKTAKPYLLLSGRILLLFMVLTLIHLDTNIVNIAQDVIELVIALFIAFGYRTKVASLFLAGWLSVINIYINSWWMETDFTDVLRYDFFQTLSVIGGLLLVSSLGAGGISVDKMKQW